MSVSHNERRVYSHRLYWATVSDFPEVFQQNEFFIDGVEYKWKTIAEMECDDRIMEINEDIVNFVKKNCS